MCSSDLRVEQNTFISELDALAKNTSTQIHVRQSLVNLGIAVSIISGLDWIASNENSFLVFEDDLEINHDFFFFAENMLDVFAQNDDVVMISGNRFTPLESNDFSISWTNYSQTWGWATWSEKWKVLREEAISSHSRSVSFSLNKVKNFWHFGTRRVQSGYIDTWDIPISAFMYKQGKLCLLPPVNLVKNIGFDTFSTHTVKPVFPMNYETMKLPESFKLLAPTHLVLEEMNAFLQSSVFRIPRRASFLPIYYFLHSLIRRRSRVPNLVKRLGNLRKSDFLFLSF